MRLLFICHEYPPAKLVGGIGIFVKNIAKALVAENHSVSVIGNYRQEFTTNEVNEDGVQIIRIAATKLMGFGWLKQRLDLIAKIKQLHKEVPFDLIETSDFESGFWWMPALKLPLVVRLHGGETYFRTLLNEPLKPRHHHREKVSLKKAFKIFSVSEYTWLETKRLFDLKDQEVAILRNPVDTSYFKPGEQIRLGCILYTGTFIRKKGVLELFKSLPKVFDQIEHAHLICIGADSRDAATNSPSTQALALSLLDKKYHERVQFTGRIEHSKVLEFIQQAQVCVYPSYLEAFPNAWIEAMACGKAVIGSSTGSGPEVIRDGETGLLCHPTDHAGLASKIIQVLTDDILRERLSRNARRYTVEHLDISSITQQNLKWYKKVIDQHNRC